jgi:hypothetical protein
MRYTRKMRPLLSLSRSTSSMTPTTTDLFNRLPKSLDDDTIRELRYHLARAPAEIRCQVYEYFFGESSAIMLQSPTTEIKFEHIYKRGSTTKAWRFRRLDPDGSPIFDPAAVGLGAELFHEFLDEWCKDKTIGIYADETRSTTSNWLDAPSHEIMEAMRSCRVNAHLSRYKDPLYEAVSLLTRLEQYSRIR